MKKNKLLSIFVAIVLIFINIFPTTSYAENEGTEIEELYAISAALIDGDSGRVLYEKEGYEIRPMASTTKIMTLILALEYGNSEDIITVSSYAAKMPDVQLGIKEGEQYQLSDLYYSLMLESHNDVAVAIAEHIGGDVVGFSNMMNKKAKELGLEDTYFITPNGLDATDENGVHSTTAVDLASLMKYCVMDSPRAEEFKKICQASSYSFTNFEGSRSFTVNNKNAFLNMLEGVLAGKTGFTADAGYCYVVAITRDDKTYIVALLGCGWPNNKSYKWKDTKKLLEYGIDNYSVESITCADTPMKTIDIPNGTPKDIVHTYIKDYDSLLISKTEKVTLKYNVPEALSPPIRAGDIVGNISIMIDGSVYKTINVYSKDTVYYKDYKYYLNMIVRVLF